MRNDHAAPAPFGLGATQLALRADATMVELAGDCDCLLQLRWAPWTPSAARHRM